MTFTSMLARPRRIQFNPSIVRRMPQHIWAQSSSLYFMIYERPVLKSFRMREYQYVEMQFKKL